MCPAMRSAQRGFAGVVYLVIGLIAIVMAAFAYISRSASTSSEDHAVSGSVPVMLKQAADFKSAFDHMMVAGATANAITFDDTPGTGMFDAAQGARFAVRHIPPPTVLTAGSTATFTYSKQIRLPAIGGSGDDYVVTVAYLTLRACQTVNRQLYGDAASAAPASSTGSVAGWRGLSAVDDSGSAATNYSARPEGCVATADGHYVYYKALYEN